MRHKNTEGMRVVVICGSVRPRSITNSAMRVLVDELQKEKAVVDVIDPTGVCPPYLGAPFAEPYGSDLKKRVAQADGVILCTPEYNGSFSSVLMAIIENLGYPVVFAGKPVGLLGVAGGRIGAIKALEHLRSVCSHNGALVLPLAISIAEAKQHFNQDGLCINHSTDSQIRSIAQAMVAFLRRGDI